MFQTKTEVVPKLENLISYEFKNKDLGWEALQAKRTNGFPEGNKRLALIGDAYLRLKILHLWYPTGQSAQIGDNRVSSASKNANLTRLGRRVGLEGYFNPNPSQQGGVTDSQIADTFEGIIGAVYEDGGEAVLGVVLQRLGLL